MSGMSWSNAAIAALVIMAGTLFTSFLPQWNFTSINREPDSF
jgi:hypothetical protein